MSAAREPWNPVQVRPGHHLHCQVGALILRLFPNQEEWYYAATRASAETVEDSIRIEQVRRSPPELEWQRWVTGAGEPAVRLTPVMPDRPIVVRSVTPLKLAQGSTAHYFIAIPIWVQVSVGLTRPTDLGQEPSQVLSNTWFGDPASGELCYALGTGLHSAPVGRDFLPCTAVCPITVRNVSSSILEFQRLCVHVEYLDIFQGRTYLWTGGVRVSFKGVEQLSQIEIEVKPAGVDGPFRPVARARKRMERNLIRRSFSMLKLFSGW